MIILKNYQNPCRGGEAINISFVGTLVLENHSILIMLYVNPKGEITGNEELSSLNSNVDLEC